MIPSRRSADVIVVGAGIVGTACAYTLSERGFRVLLIDEAFPGAGTTSAAMGHIVAMDDSEAELALTKFSRDCWEEIALILPTDCADRASGTTWVAATDEEWAIVGRRASIYRSHGVSADVLDGKSLAELEPNLRPGLHGALHIPHDRVVYPPLATEWLLARARERGAIVLTEQPVTSIGPCTVRCGDTPFTADIVINATGARAADLTPGLPIVPRKGHLVVTDRYPDFCRTQLIELSYLTSAHTLSPESVAFNVHPRPNGQMIIGSSRELVGWDRAINRRVLSRMLSRATEYMPALAACQALRSWVGFRPATPDSLPLIGAWPEVEGLWIAAGHEGLGVTTAIGTARLLAAMITGDTPPIDPSPYAPSRTLTEAVV